MTFPIDYLPPPFEGHERPHVVRMDAREGSIISEINHYASQAEIRRIVKFDAQKGANQVILSQLPITLEEDSVRVEGSSTIAVHEVIVARTPPVHLSQLPIAREGDSLLVGYSSTMTEHECIAARMPPVDLDPEASQKLKALRAEEQRRSVRLSRSEAACVALASYVSSANPGNLPSSELGEMFSRFKETADSLEDERAEAWEKLEQVKNEIATIRAEDRRQDRITRNQGMQATVSLYCEHGGSVAIAFIYSVWCASWTVTYDVRVNMDTKEKPVVLIYKACISQSSGEDWNNVALTLQTVQQSLNVVIPELSSWALTKYRPPVRFGLRKTHGLRPSKLNFMLKRRRHPWRA